MVNIAIIGIGAISGIYLENLTKVFGDVSILGVCDLIRTRAEKAQADYSIPKLYETMYDAFADPDVHVILNLTRPYEHYEVTKAALNANKHVYTEKPLATDMVEGKALAELAESKNLLLGGAPDTFMGAGIQTCRKLIDDGWIGEPVGTACFMICRGHETWHPDPAFYYKRGGGPMMDMGPYYITALVSLLGSVNGLMGVTRRSFNRRLITSEPYKGHFIDVDVDTTINGILYFSSGITGTIYTTFDVYYAPHNQARFEIYGSKGTLIVPDPNTFGGPVCLFRPEDQEKHKTIDPAYLYSANNLEGFREIPLMFDYSVNSRGLGVADLCRALETGRDARAGRQQIYHVLEILTAFEKSSELKAYQPMETSYKRSVPMSNHPLHGYLD